MLNNKEYKIAVAGTGYVGLSNAILLAQNNDVYAVDIVPEKVEMINNKKSPIVDKEIEEYLATKELRLTATTDAEVAYKDADFVIMDGSPLEIKSNVLATFINGKKVWDRENGVHI